MSGTANPLRARPSRRPWGRVVEHEIVWTLIEPVLHQPIDHGVSGSTVVAYGIGLLGHAHRAQSIHNQDPIVASQKTFLLPRGRTEQGEEDDDTGPDTEQLDQADIDPTRRQPLAEVLFQERLERLRDPTAVQHQRDHLVYLPDARAPFVDETSEKIQEQARADRIDLALVLHLLEQGAHRVEKGRRVARVQRRRRRSAGGRRGSTGGHPGAEKRLGVVRPAPDGLDRLLPQLVSRYRTPELAENAILVASELMRDPAEVGEDVGD